MRPRLRTSPSSFLPLLLLPPAPPPTHTHTCMVDTKRPPASTGTSVPASRDVMRGVATTAASVEAVVIMMDS